MAVSLDKTPQLLFFLAVVTDAGTDRAEVHSLLLTRDADYDSQVDYMHVQRDMVDGGELVCVVAGDRSEAYREARRGDCNEELMSRWIDQERLRAGL
ncbi:hypothetical protein ABTY59_31985 [Streptomyces sp. NPDC096079]|uniref:hypothetical protein n=1 Tax=Streptomyces sp. NPDC096079 TaxID=3155820 RepID=UPI003320551C